MNLRQKVLKGVVWTALQNFGSQIISFVVFSLLARLLGPEVFGLVALAGIFLAFVQIFTDQGLSAAIVQRQELDPEHLDTAFWINVGTGILLTVFGIAAAGVVANIFNEPQLAPIVRWLSLSFLFSAFNSVQSAILSRELAFKSLAIRTLVANFIGGVVGVVMAFQGFGVWSLVGQQLVNGLVAIFVLWRVSDWRPGLNISAKHYQELFAFGINDVGFNVFNFFSRRGDDLLIGYFLGHVALGYYTIAYRVLLLMTQLLISTTSKVALPTFSRLQQEPERLRRAFYTATQLSSLVAVPAFLGVVVLAPELVQVLFGSKWLPSIPVMQVLSFAGVLQSVSYFNGSVIVAMGKPSWRLGITVLNSVSNIVAYALVVHWGIVAVAAAFVIRGYLFSPLPIWMIHKLIHLELSVYLRQYVVPLVSSLVMVIAILGVKYVFGELVSVYMLLSICIAIASVVYGLMIWWTMPQVFQQLLDLFHLVVHPKKERKL